MNADDPGRRVDGVDRERAPDHQPLVVGEEDLQDLAGARRDGDRRRMEGVDPLVGEDDPPLDQLRRNGLRGHGGMTRDARCPDRLAVVVLRGLLGVALGLTLAVVVIVTFALGGDGRERLGERVGEIAEDVGGVVVLDEVLR